MFHVSQTLNLSRQHGLLLSKLDDHKRLVMAVAENEVPRIHQLLRQALKEGAGVSKILAKLEDGLCGVYHARGYSADDRDIALLVLRLGGRKLLYAMSQHISIPSIRYLRHHSAFTKLTPSLGTPSLNEIKGNIDAVLASRPKTVAAPTHRPYVSGVCIQWDEISIEEVADWFPSLNAVGGFCREHSAGIDTTLSTFESAVSIATALHEGTVHHGKEASVIAVGSYGVAVRGVFPILVSPTCKTEAPHDSAALLRTVFHAWRKSVASQLGPIWSFASDGDAGRRAMVYSMFMKHSIETRHSLYKYVGHLPGFNRQVGDNDVTGDFDWKHELKRTSLILYLAVYRIIILTHGYL